MQSNPSAEESRQALHDIRSMMERSSRFLSLSGWSGVWAGCTALAGAAIGYSWLPAELLQYRMDGDAAPFCFCGAAFYKPLILALAILAVALAGGYYFTLRKMRREGASLNQPATRQMLWAMAVPMLAGAVFILAFMRYGHPNYIAPACLIFYGLALVNSSKHTLTDIRNLGYLEMALGAICLFIPGWGLYFWVAGFGLLHILYGVMMWNKYDKRIKS